MKAMKGLFIILIGLNTIAAADGHVQALPAPVYLAPALPTRTTPFFPFYEAKRRIEDIFYYRSWTDAQKISASKEQVLGFVLQYAKQKLTQDDYQQLNTYVKELRQPEYQYAEKPSPGNAQRQQPKALFEEAVQVADTVPANDDFETTGLVKKYLGSMR